MHVVHVAGRHAAVLQQPYEMLRHNRHPSINVYDGLVAHVQGAHQLQGRNLQWEVERGDQPHRPEGPPVAVALLSRVVPRHTEGARQEAHLIPREVFQEQAGHSDLRHGLCIVLGGHTLDEPRKEVRNLRLAHFLSYAGRDGTVHEVTLRVLQRVVHPRLWDSPQALNEWRSFILRDIRIADEGLAVQRVRDGLVLGSAAPLTIHAIVSLPRRRS
mmetsp:Transcript_2466/g.7399  ORF Transcript_2466/g.7399 Transcript_2466/m.7399 type:complete len:215 (-) Transcript_2466:310-954(-)